MVQIERSALFKGSKTRKSNKSSLAAILRKGVPFVAEVRGAKMVLGGGSLLHHVRWHCPCTYNVIVEQYVTYVFDGYLQGHSTKDHEHARRSKNMTANIQFRGSMIAHRPQQSFLLSNERNKSQFLSLLMDAFEG